MSRMDCGSKEQSLKTRDREIGHYWQAQYLQTNNKKD